LVKQVDKDWGHEIWLANNEKENYCGKILYIEEGKSTSMHFHSKKHESFYILEGTLCIHIVDTNTTKITPHYIKQGERFVMDRFVPHKLEAHDGPVKFIEISTFHEDNDSYRIYR
jgi:mannose-6-phosphate isomerase-like protein (cupin superfamily)